MKLIRTEYLIEQGKPIIYLFQRVDKKRVIIRIDDFVPYFYCLDSEIDNLKGIRSNPNIYHSIYGEPVRKVYTTLPSDVPDLREKYTHHFEADVLYNLRYLIDKVDYLEEVNLTVMCLDIETGNSGTVPDVLLAEEPVICVTCYCNDTYTSIVYRNDLKPGYITDIFDDSLSEIYYCRTEEQLLERLLDYIVDEEPDVITGWNCSRFDLPYLINRMKRLDIDYQRLSPILSVYIREQKEIVKGSGVVIKGLSIVDLYDAYRKFSQNMEESYKLGFIGKKVAGIEKTESGSNVTWLWNNDIDKLIRYNMTDTMIVVKIDQKMRLIEFLDELRRLCYCNLEDCLVASRMSDTYILRMFYNKVVFPTKETHEKYDYEGAFVGNWATGGVQENVVVFDIRSLYPSIISSCNLSPETISNSEIQDTIKLNNVWVEQHHRGFLPQVIDSLFEQRTRYKDLMKNSEIDSAEYSVYYARQYAIKIILNALYGQTSYTKSRYYDHRVAETTTYIGRKIINWSKDFIENIGYKVIYLDTDSLHFSIGNTIDINLVETILDMVNDSYNDFTKEIGLNDHIFKMEFEKIYRRAFYGTAKKRYAGSICYKDGKEVDKLDIWGFETKRSDSSQFTRQLMETVFDMLLGKDCNRDEVVSYIVKQINRIRQHGYSFTEIGIPRGITKNIENYGKISGGNKIGLPAHIRGTIYSTKLGLDISSKPKMIYVSGMPNGYEPTDVLCFDDDYQVPSGTTIDIEKMLEKLVKDKMTPIFDALNWSINELSPFWHNKTKSGEQLVLL